MFKPQCMPFNIEDGVAIPVDKKLKGLAFVQGGHFMPCVWCNQKKYRDVLHKHYGLCDNELKITNNTTVKDILSSKQWKQFVDDLAVGKIAIDQCVRRCGGDSVNVV
jgi:hypothetical protein